MLILLSEHVAYLMVFTVIPVFSTQTAGKFPRLPPWSWQSAAMSLRHSYSGTESSISCTNKPPERHCRGGFPFLFRFFRQHTVIQADTCTAFVLCLHTPAEPRRHMGAVSNTPAATPRMPTIMAASSSTCPLRTRFHWEQEIQSRIHPAEIRKIPGDSSLTQRPIFRFRMSTRIRASTSRYEFPSGSSKRNSISFLPTKNALSLTAQGEQIVRGTT